MKYEQALSSKHLKQPDDPLHLIKLPHSLLKRSLALLRVHFFYIWDTSSPKLHTSTPHSRSCVSTFWCGQEYTESAIDKFISCSHICGHIGKRTDSAPQKESRTLPTLAKSYLNLIVNNKGQKQCIKQLYQSNIVRVSWWLDFFSENVIAPDREAWKGIRVSHSKRPHKYNIWVWMFSCWLKSCFYKALNNCYFLAHVKIEYWDAYPTV